MKIIVIGAGFTGTQLAKKLVDEKNDVVLIDNDEETARHAANHLDCAVFQTDGHDLSKLEEAGVASADALVTLTDSDEYNMITCSLVDAVYPKILKIARVRDYAYYVKTRETARHHAATFSRDRRPLYGIDFMIHPDVEAAEKIVRAVEHGAVGDVLALGDAFALTAVAVEPGSPLDGTTPKGLHAIVDCPFVIAYVEKGGGTSLPSGDTALRAGDCVGVLSSEGDVPKFLGLGNAKVGSLRKVAILGAGRVGTLVAERIAKRRQAPLFKTLLVKSPDTFAQSLFIVDEDEARCREASERFPEAKVLCGNIADEGLVQEERLDQCDLVAATAHDYERNIVIAAYMKSLGVSRTVALASNAAFSDVARKLGIDVAVPMRDAVVDSIMSHLRGRNVLAIHTVAKGDFEIVECDIDLGGKFTGKTLRQIARPGEFLILLVRPPDADRYELPTGDTALPAGTHVVLIARTGDEKTLRRFGK